MKLFNALLAGDETAFEKLCATYSESVRSLARTFIARNPNHAHLKDDLISEGVLSVVTALRSIQSQKDVSIESLSGYMVTSIRHGFLTLVENEQGIRIPLKKRKGKPEAPKLKQATYDLSEVPERLSADMHELLDGLRTVCDGEFDMAVCQMRMDGFDDPTIAKLLSVSRSTVQRIRRKIEERYREKH